MIADDAFWAKVDKGGECWLWTGYTDSRGYGQVRRRGVVMYAHRYALTLAGVDLGEQQVDHICHQPSCVRLDHLRPVTNKQNSENLRGSYRNSKSGVRGVYWDRANEKWCATVGHAGTRHFKRFDSLDDAAAWARAKRVELFTHNDLDRVG